MKRKEYCLGGHNVFYCIIGCVTEMLDWTIADFLVFDALIIDISIR